MVLSAITLHPQGRGFKYLLSLHVFPMLHEIPSAVQKLVIRLTCVSTGSNHVCPQKVKCPILDVPNLLLKQQAFISLMYKNPHSIFPAL